MKGRFRKNLTAPGEAVLVTGASTGIGRACAEHLFRKGYLVFAGVRTEEAARSLKACGEEIIPVRLDVRDPAQIREAAAVVQRKVGHRGLRGLVNNAGIATAGPMEYVAPEDLREQFDVNFFGAVAVIQAFREMLRTAPGRIINISSISGRVVFPIMGPYAASKFALEAASDALRMELSGTGVHVVVVEPGRIATPIWEKARHDAQERFEGLSTIARDRYDQVLRSMQDRTEDAERNAVPASRVARVVARALGAHRPRPRYLVGRDARLNALLGWALPDRVRDSLVLRRLEKRVIPSRPAARKRPG